MLLAKEWRFQSPSSVTVPPSFSQTNRNLLIFCSLFSVSGMQVVFQAPDVCYQCQHLSLPFCLKSNSSAVTARSNSKAPSAVNQSLPLCSRDRAPSPLTCTPAVLPEQTLCFHSFHFCSMTTHSSQSRQRAFKSAHQLCLSHNGVTRSRLTVPHDQKTGKFFSFPFQKTENQKTDWTTSDNWMPRTVIPETKETIRGVIWLSWLPEAVCRQQKSKHIMEVLLN